MADIDRLTVVFDANLKALDAKLDKVIRSNYGAARKVEKAWDNANDNIGRKFGRGIGKTFNNEISSLAAGAGRASTALSSFGTAGLVAAAGVAALGAAFTGARAATKFADDIADTADRLHVSTDALQEYRYAIRAAGGDTKGADEALENFSTNLGLAQAGLKKGQRAFLELGFTKEQIKGFTDADTALKAVVERIAGLSDVQQDAVIKQLGLEGIKPLIDDGVASMEALRAEAHKVGVVMDAELVKRGAELNDQFETVAQVIDIQLKSALVDLAPILLGLIKLVADLARAAASVVDAFRSIENKTTQGLQGRRTQLSEEATRLGLRGLAGKRLSIPEQQRLARVNEQISGIDSTLASRQASNAPKPITPTRSLIDTSKTGGGGRKTKGVKDSTIQRTKQVNAALDDAERDLLQAWLSLTNNVENRADIQKAVLDVEQQMLNDRLDAQIAEIKADEGLTEAKKAQLVASLESVRIEQDKVDKLKRELVDRETAERLAEQALEKQQLVLDGETELLQLQESLARTAAERRDLQLKLLDAADQHLKAELDAVIASKTASDADKELARIKLGQLEASRGLRQEQVRQNTQGPLESYFDKLPQTIDEVNEAFQNMETEGISSLIDGLAAASVGAANLGDVFRNTIRQMAQEANKILLQSLLSGAGGGANGSGGFLKSLLKIGASSFGNPTGGMNIIGADGGFIPFASGGNVRGPGTGTSDSVPAMLSDGEFVINAQSAAKHRKLLEAINSGQHLSRFASGGLVSSLSRPPVSQTSNNTVNANFTVQAYPGQTAADARRTGRQMATAFQQEVAGAKRAGF